MSVTMDSILILVPVCFRFHCLYSQSKSGKSLMSYAVHWPQYGKKRDINTEFCLLSAKNESYFILFKSINFLYRLPIVSFFFNTAPVRMSTALAWASPLNKHCIKMVLFWNFNKWLDFIILNYCSINKDYWPGRLHCSTKGGLSSWTRGSKTGERETKTVCGNYYSTVQVNSVFSPLS